MKGDFAWEGWGGAGVSLADGAVSGVPRGPIGPAPAVYIEGVCPLHANGPSIRTSAAALEGIGRNRTNERTKVEKKEVRKNHLIEFLPTTRVLYRRGSAQMSTSFHLRHWRKVFVTCSVLAPFKQCPFL